MKGGAVFACCWAMLWVVAGVKVWVRAGLGALPVLAPPCRFRAIVQLHRVGNQTLSIITA